MGFKTFAAGDVLTASDVNTYLMKQAVITCTSSTRPTPLTGMAIYETDTYRSLQYDGTGWVIMGEPVQTYTPTYTNFSSTSPTAAFRYHRSDGFCEITGTYTFGTAVSVTGRLTLSLPSGCDASLSDHQVSFFGLAQGTGNFPLYVSLLSTTTFDIYTYNAAAAASATLVSTSATSPQTWATGHQFRVGLRYQMANRYS